ncbi:GNAT family N-acetyltransferase [Xenorhabdus nematophila]|uniref:hypothetical protein n=1 Tax=Xenorhabdus nematophila TaxID=628 RepID=UPI0003275AFC|nr:hypothetical protein [Xenorhabdus nematophila]CCW30408.1 conserved hypothetical protein [Xenorhabdus nematophila F1]
MNIFNLKCNIFGWQEVDFSEYEKTYFSYGGNLATHPSMLKFIHDKYSFNERYFIKKNNSEINASICVWDNKYVVNDPACPFSDKIAIAIPNDEIVIPASKESKFLLPIKTKFISPLNSDNVINTTFRFNARRSLCLAKPLSKKSNKKYKNRLNSFIKSGGKIIDSQMFHADELASIYFNLVEKRWGGCSFDKEMTHQLFHLIKPMIFGNVLFFNDQPCAFHLITQTQFHDYVNIEFIQAGMDNSDELSKFSIGSLLIWSNIYKAESEFENVRFSFGRPSRDYKLRWSDTYPIGRTITLF